MMKHIRLQNALRASRFFRMIVVAMTALSITELCAADAAPTIEFTPSILVDSTDIAVNHTPTVTGTVTTCITYPNLPIGLKIHNTTCVISGTPRIMTPLSTYKVMASNDAGTTNFTLTITVPKRNEVSTPSALMIPVSGQEKFYAFGIESGKGTEKITLSVIDAWGRTVWSRSVNAGESKSTQVSWNGRSANGTLAAAGMYVVRASVSNGVASTNRVWKSVTLSPR